MTFRTIAIIIFYFGYFSLEQTIRGEDFAFISQYQREFPFRDNENQQVVSSSHLKSDQLFPITEIFSGPDDEHSILFSKVSQLQIKNMSKKQKINTDEFQSQNQRMNQKKLFQCKLPKIFQNGICKCPGKKLFDGQLCQETNIFQQEEKKASDLQFVEFGKDFSSKKIFLRRLIREVESFTGKNNNIEFRKKFWGSSNSPLLRKTLPQYSDSIQSVDFKLKGPMQISEQIGSFEGQLSKNYQVNLLFPYFTQFISHDLSFTPSQKYGSEFSQSMPIKIPRCDGNFDITCSGQQRIQFMRSQYSWIYEEGVFYRNQINQASAFLDLSQLYGANKKENELIREWKSGKIQQIPIIAEKNQRIVPMKERQHVEDKVLPALYELFAKYHNKICDQIVQKEDLNDEEIFQISRKILIGVFQKIVFKEYLPILIGRRNYQQFLAKYPGYNQNINPGIHNEFITAAFNFWPTMLPEYVEPELRRKRNSQQVIDFIIKKPTKERSLKGSNRVRNNYYVDKVNKKVDYYSWILQRNRDHGIPTYNKLLRAYGYQSLKNFASYTENLILAGHLIKSYNKVENMESWVGLMGEVPYCGSILGQLGTRIIVQSFNNIRNGDYFWYQNSLPQITVEEIELINLSDILSIHPTNQNIFKL